MTGLDKLVAEIDAKRGGSVATDALAAVRRSLGTGNPPLVAYIYHAHPVHPVNAFAFEASLIYIAYHYGIRLFDGVDAYARRLLGYGVADGLGLNPWMAWIRTTHIEEEAS